MPRTAACAISTSRPKRPFDRQNEKLARRALQLQVEAKATRDRAEQTYKAAKLRADNSRAKLRVEEEKVEAKIRQLGELKAVNEMNQAQRRMQEITDEYNIDGAVSVFDKVAGSIQEQADKLSAMDTIAVSEGEDLDRQLSAISKKTEVDDALEALKGRFADRGAAVAPAGSATQGQGEDLLRFRREVIHLHPPAFRVAAAQLVR